MDIIRDLRIGKFDVLIGINLLREGLDIPEVTLVAILDADKEGFLRSTRSLVQTCGRAARNVNGRIIMYAATMTRSMLAAISETDRRRKIQKKYNRRHGITPETIVKEISSIFDSVFEADYVSVGMVAESEAKFSALENQDEDDRIRVLEKEMMQAAEALSFEKAAALRDQINALRKKLVFEI